MFQKNEAIRYGERGALAGLALAVLLTMLLMADDSSGLGGLGYLAVFGFVTLFGAWVGGLLGLSTENRAIARFHDELEAGHNLILIDVRREQEEAIRRVMAERHPEARLVEVGSTLVIPFDIPRGTPA